MRMVALLATAILGLSSVGAQAGCKDHAGSGVDWTGCTKKLLVLRSATLDGAKLDGANLTSTDLGEANLDGANLDGADLSYASLKARLSRTLRWSRLQAIAPCWSAPI